MSKYLWPLIVISVILFVSFKYFSASTPSPISNGITPNTTPPLTGLNNDPPPWLPEIDHLKDRLATLNLPVLKSEGTALHTHQHLDILINGQKINIPDGIGVGPKESYISTIHTHDTSGIIHVESPVIDDFYLGQFFDIWGVKFENQCLGSFCSNLDNHLRVFINGQETNANFRYIKLFSHQEIFIYYGPDSKLPSVIPSKYTFPADY